MPDPTPLPVRIVDLGATIWEYADKAEAFARLSLYFGAFATAIIIVLIVALTLSSGLRR